MDYQDEMGKYGIKVYRKEYKPSTDDPDDYTEPIDVAFDIGGESVAWVWGSEPFRDYEIECSHPEECVDWGDDDECGECMLCGAQCSWRWVEETEYEGTDEDGDIEWSKSAYRDINEWHDTQNKGIIGKYIKHLQKVW